MSTCTCDSIFSCASLRPELDVAPLTLVGISTSSTASVGTDMKKNAVLGKKTFARNAAKSFLFKSDRIVPPFFCALRRLGGFAVFLKPVGGGIKGDVSVGDERASERASGCC